jgi:hypothetical protein
MTLAIDDDEHADLSPIADQLWPCRPTFIITRVGVPASAPPSPADT